MEYQFSPLIEYKSAYVSQGKEKLGERNFFFTEDIKCTLIWWYFAKVKLYLSHWYNQNCIIDAAYERKDSVEGYQFAQCHHI